MKAKALGKTFQRIIFIHKKDTLNFHNAYLGIAWKENTQNKWELESAFEIE